MDTNIDERVERATELILERVRKVLPGMETFDFLAAVCMLKAASKSKIVIENLNSVREQLDGKIWNLIYDYSKVDVCWNDIKEIAQDFDTEVFDEILLRKSPVMGYSDKEREDVPDGLTSLIFRLIDLHDEDNLANLYPRNGMLLVNTAKTYPATTLTALVPNNLNVYENGEFNAKNLYLRNVGLGNRIAIDDKKDLADLINTSKRMKKFNKIISTHPFGLRGRNISKRFAEIQQELPFVKTGTAGDWVFCSSVMRQLEEDGVAVALMSMGCLFTAQDKEAREHFIKYGYINTIISLPKKLFAASNLSCALVVLSRGNESVRLVDASEVYTAGRRQNELTADNISSIVEACRADSEFSRIVDNADFAKNGYILSPERYFTVTGHIENGQQLKDLVEFSRGINLKASQLDEMTIADDDESKASYLRLSDISDGVVNDVLPKLKSIDKEYEKYQLEDKDIILSRNGAPFKVAIYEGKAGKKVYPVGNLYVLRVNSNRLNPYYLKAFLESEQGTDSLKHLLTGIAIQVISLEKLKKMVVPVPSMNEQNKIAAEYRAIMDELEELKERTRIVKDKLAHVLDSYKEGELDAESDT